LKRSRKIFRKSSAPLEIKKLQLNKDMNKIAKHFAFLRHDVKIADNMELHGDPEEAIDEILIDAIFRSEESIVVIGEMKKKIKKHLQGLRRKGLI